jgi:hypothetical protein
MMDNFIYGLTMRGDWIADIVSRVWFRWRCPYPIIPDHSVQACREAGHCGCSHAKEKLEA